MCQVLETLRKPKLFDIALFDLLATLLVAYLIHHYAKIKCPLWSVLVGSILLGIVVHVMIGTPTMLNYYLGLSAKPKR
jgi:hypothetical protein